MPVITMTGATASGAREVGRRVANLLGIDFVDQQLMVQAARRCGVPVGAVAEHDERAATFRKRLASVLGSMLEASGASGADPLTSASGLEAVLSQTYVEMARGKAERPIDEGTYARAMEGIIRELAASGQIVILGRGGQMILGDSPRVLHVMCHAPAEVRWQRYAEAEGVGMEEARRRAEDSDQARAAFYRKLWKVDVEDAKLYDLVLDTSRLSYDAAAETAAAAARAKAE